MHEIIDEVRKKLRYARRLWDNDCHNDELLSEEEGIEMVELLNTSYYKINQLLDTLDREVQEQKEVHEKVERIYRDDEDGYSDACERVERMLLLQARRTIGIDEETIERPRFSFDY